MVHYQCASCPYGSDDLDDLQRHSDKTGHVGICKNDAGSTGNKLGTLRVVAEVLGVAALGASVWIIKELRDRLGESEEENDYLKSASGAGKTLKSYDV